VSDNGPDDCTVSIMLDSFDCNDPCFLVRADFGYDINFSTREVSFNDESKGNIIAWSWDFGDGSSSNLENPVHTFSEAILYDVCLTITDVSGCFETSCDKLRLGADICHAGFTYQQNGLEFVFYNTSDVSADNITATWTFGDGMNSTQFDSTEHSYASGLYEACITVTASGCVDTYCEILDLTDPCLSLRSKYQATPAGNELHYQFTDQSSGPVGSRLWGFGDGQISSEQHPYHVYSNIGEYTVCLLILDEAGQCTDSDCRTLYVGTTGIEGGVKLSKLMVMPNPVSIAAPEVHISGFDQNDIGRKACVIIHDINGTSLRSEELMLEAGNDIKLPDFPGVYFLRVVTEKNTYGAMIAVQ
jgi:PKD repeat protein